MIMKAFFEVFKAALRRRRLDQATRMAAALSFYTALSLAPLLILAVAVAGMFYSSQAAQTQLLAHVQSTLGDPGVALFETVLSGATVPGAGVVAGVLSLLMLILGASGLFGELQEALNTVWQVPFEQTGGWRVVLRSRLFSFGMVVSVGVLLFLSLISSLALSLVTRFVGRFSSPTLALLPKIDLPLSFLIFTGLFGVIYKLLPRTRVAWRDVWYGAAVASALFLLGKFLLSIYLAQGTVGSLYGAAGSLVVVLVWVFYSAQILLFGAEFADVYASRYGSLAVRLPVERVSAENLPPIQTITQPPTVAAPPVPPPARAQPSLAQWLGALVLLAIGMLIGARDTRK